MSSMTENLLNASLLTASWRMLDTLQDIVAQLESHPDVRVGNSKVHYVHELAKGAIAKAIKINAHDHGNSSSTD